ncbi:hypothetical protein HNP52_002004 [Sphingomonas kyeonggiensis]|uniref:Lipocalin-like protein n=1 Tax=Sphingomonas kyeonggiensis TaxID=1268553 RepID=A0A7W7K1Z4_9SPHN|nr:hypothetical protein [Sphingomonas kyeonggiensis]MBB4838935.1 hypothetical protein [Sphingomonas kyeonggiensis]
MKSCPVLVTLLVVPALFAAATVWANGDEPKLAGNWSQASTGQELVIAPKFKLQPSMTPNYGTSLGGTVGTGSYTNTTIVTEATPMRVDRRMSLSIRPDGSYSWRITKTQPEGARCTRTIEQEKHGRVSIAGDKISFATNSGTEAWRSSCGKSGTGTVAAITETYRYSLAGGALSVRGSGGVNWQFRRN